MSLEFIGIDPSTGGGGSPTVWVQEETEEIIVQTYTADPALCATIAETVWVPGHATGIPSSEGVFRIPARMVPILREACDRVERAGLHRAAEERSEDCRTPGDA